jgi:hypothetical protein
MVRTPTEVPPVSDPSWARLAADLLPYMEKKSRTWPELKAWAKKRKMKQETLRNVVAWCETHELARDGVLQDQVVWIALFGWKEALAGVPREHG